MDARTSTEIPTIKAQHASFRLQIRPSPIHRWGVYALEKIPARRKVIEYTGEKVSRRETKRRAEHHLNYLFTLTPYWCIDGAVGGSGAEYINHSCEPNVQAVVLKGHIIYTSLREIKKGEELLIDYHFDAHVEKVPCSCGSLKCRGTINVKEDRRRLAAKARKQAG